MNKLLLAAALGCALLSTKARAQDSAFSPFNCVVSDMDGAPIKGVKVFCHSPNQYSVSDKKGRFGLSNVQPQDTLILRHKRVEYVVPVLGRSALRIRLCNPMPIVEEDVELASFGYGFVKRRELLVASDGVPGSVLAASGHTNLIRALQGCVPGLIVDYSNRNGGAKVRIRGDSSLSSDMTPLFVVDGTIVDSIDDVNVASVDYVEVLKSAYIYGSRGANGAIIVHTKK